MGPYPSLDDLDVDGLRDEVYRSCGQGPGFLGGVLLAGDEDHRSVPGGLGGVEPAADLQAVHIGHEDVEQH